MMIRVFVTNFCQYRRAYFWHAL